MKRKKFLRIDLFLLVVIGLLISFTYNPTNAKFFKKSEPNEALTYSASFYKMGGYEIPDNPDANIVKNDSTAGIIRYRYEFIRTKGMKDEEIDKYTLRDLPSACTNISFYDSTTNTYSNDKSISFNYKNDGAPFVLNLACYVDRLIDGDNIKLDIKLDQQFISTNNANLNDLVYEYYTGTTTIAKDEYFVDKEDRLEDNKIYLIRSNNENIYRRFVDYLTIYLNQDSDFVNYLTNLTEKSFNSLLTEYLGLSETASIDDIKKIPGVVFSTTFDNGYNVFTITSDFKTNFRNYFANKDIIFENRIKLSKSYLGDKILPERIVEFLASQENIESKEIVPYIEKNLGNLSDIASEYGKVKGLTYNDIDTHDLIEIEPNFSSYVKTSYNNNDTSSSPKNFYFYNTSLDKEGINNLFYEYLDEYLCKNYKSECDAVKKYVQDNLDSTTTNVIELANKLNSTQQLNYFYYSNSEHLLHITSDFYNIILNKKDIIHEVQRSRNATVKLKSLENKLKTYGYKQEVINEILTNSKLNDIYAIIDVTEEINSGEILINVNVENIIYKITVEVKSPAGSNFINTFINIIEETATADDINGNDESVPDEVVTPPIDDVSGGEVTEDSIKDPSEEVIEDITDYKEETEINKEDEEEKDNEEGEATDPEVEVDTKTQDEVGIISYPIDTTLDNTLGEEKKYMYIKPEDE